MSIEDYPRVVADSNQASISLASGDVVHCWQEGARVFKVAVARGREVHVVASRDSLFSLTDAELAQAVLARAIEIAEAGHSADWL
jgi:hypothetical protein